MVVKVSLDGFTLPCIPVVTFLGKSCSCFIEGTTDEIHLRFLALDTGEALLSNDWTFLSWWIQLIMSQKAPSSCIICVNCKQGNMPNTAILSSKTKLQTDQIQDSEDICHRWMLYGNVEQIDFVFDDLHNQQSVGNFIFFYYKCYFLVPVEIYW